MCHRHYRPQGPVELRALADRLSNGNPGPLTGKSGRRASRAPSPTALSQRVLLVTLTGALRYSGPAGFRPGYWRTGFQGPAKFIGSGQPSRRNSRNYWTQWSNRPTGATGPTGALTLPDLPEPIGAVGAAGPTGPQELLALLATGARRVNGAADLLDLQATALLGAL